MTHLLGFAMVLSVNIRRTKV